MSILPIITVPNTLLEMISLPVEEVNDDIRKLMNDLVDTMRHNGCSELAAIQLGFLKQVFVIDPSHIVDKSAVEVSNNYSRLQSITETSYKTIDEPTSSNYSDKNYAAPLYMANPKILEKSKATTLVIEKCLSIPGQSIEVERFQTIKLKYLDYHNNLQTLEVDGSLASLVQHACSHLYGININDCSASAVVNSVDYSDDSGDEAGCFGALPNPSVGVDLN